MQRGGRRRGRHRRTGGRHRQSARCPNLGGENLLDPFGHGGAATPAGAGGQELAPREPTAQMGLNGLSRERRDRGPPTLRLVPQAGVELLRKLHGGTSHGMPAYRPLAEPVLVDQHVDPLAGRRASAAIRPEVLDRSVLPLLRRDGPALSNEEEHLGYTAADRIDVRERHTACDIRQDAGRPHADLDRLRGAQAMRRNPQRVRASHLVAAPASGPDTERKGEQQPGRHRMDPHMARLSGRAKPDGRFRRRR